MLRQKIGKVIGTLGLLACVFTIVAIFRTGVKLDIITGLFLGTLLSLSTYVCVQLLKGNIN